MAEAGPWWIIGLMSGTSMDGVDAALIETDGERVLSFGPALTLPYSDAQRAILREAISVAGGAEGATPHDEIMKTAEALLTETHAAAVAKVTDAAGLTAGDIHYAGFHGQTVLHRPHQKLTWQIGDGAGLAAATGIDVVFDFRSDDVAAGGQGAPLVPLYHQALVQGLQTELPVAVLNIGGVANVTWVGRDGALLAFDTGPGNAAIDDWVFQHTGQSMDKDGFIALGGLVDGGLLMRMLDNPWLDQPPPKSLDRMDFTADAVRGLTLENGAATLTAFTAFTVARAARHFPEPAKRWLVCGGGRRNPVLMGALHEALWTPVERVETVGWRGDFLEAEAFAFLAARHLRGLPLSLPTTTGVPTPLTGGRLAKKP
ncbi:Anhydro-N-acetylmuramic acid kinase [Alphaproteobacteria bacterium SO-S41]|nr:Anhydro-N-acetylmuramic acid kinase [Alphaproteobacteria bacterium SO-S41]